MRKILYDEGLGVKTYDQAILRVLLAAYCNSYGNLLNYGSSLLNIRGKEVDRAGIFLRSQL